MKGKPTFASDDVRRWLGQPVCVVLKDGSRYVGWLTGVANHNVTLSGRKERPDRPRSAKVSAYVPGMFGGGEWGFNPFQFAAGAPAATATGSGFGFGNFMGMMRKVWPDVQFGMGMIQTIIPFMKSLQL